MKRQDFIRFIENLRTDLSVHLDKLINKTVGEYIETIARYAEDIQCYYDNTGQRINADNADWQTFSDIMNGGTIYE